MAPGTCADTVVWRTASTMASKLDSLAEPAAPCTVTVAVFEVATAWVRGALSAGVATAGSVRRLHVRRARRVAAVAEWRRVMLDSLA